MFCEPKVMGKKAERGQQFWQTIEMQNDKIDEHIHLIMRGMAASFKMKILLL